MNRFESKNRGINQPLQSLGGQPQSGPGSDNETKKSQYQTTQTTQTRRHTMKRALLITTCLLLAGLAPARADDIKAAWEKDCQKCHGPDGKGDTKMGKKVEVKDYTDPVV